MDEIHEMLSDEYSKVFNFSKKQLLGLTATPPRHNHKYMERLEKWSPIVYEKYIEEGVQMLSLIHI